MCRKPGGDTPATSLHIDHDAWLGDWAVRDLLCTWCNTQLGRHALPADVVATYLADPWHATLPPVIAEPPVGTTVHGFRRRSWTRVDETTWRSVKYYSTARWDRLVYVCGPHLRVA